MTEAKHPTTAPGAAPAPGTRVAVAMSGGVDSSVAAALLVEQGYEVVGVHMKLHDLPDSEKRDRSCCSIDDALDARQACARLGIPFYVVDFIEDFRHHVIDYFEASYAAGRTPNPCVQCNQTVKSTLLMDKVREFGCTHLATGHYARTRYNPQTGAWELLRAADRRKDQTYFLFGTPAEEVPHLLFPLAEYEKARTREVAEAHGFLTAGKPDSQNICFVTTNTRDYLSKRLDQTRNPPGELVHVDGTVLGTHQGMALYTIGQRRGLGVSAAEPLYVVALRPEANQVVLGPESALYRDRLHVTDVNWCSRPAIHEPLRATVKVRYAHGGTPATLTPTADGGVGVHFDEPVRAVTPGQAAVFYDGEVLLGGGFIAAEAA